LVTRIYNAHCKLSELNNYPERQEIFQMYSLLAHSLPAQLRTLIVQHEFLSLESSKTMYPNAPGDGLPLVVVNTPKCRAVIALQGAQLLEFVPAGGEPLLWLSPNCNFSPGTALRGGIPVCLPWFGVNRADSTKPKHGFARNQAWDLNKVEMNSAGNCSLTFALTSAPNLLFDYAFTAELCLTLGEAAKLELSVKNQDTRQFTCSWALHSYHPVALLVDVRVTGLAGREYFDNLEGYARKQQLGDVSFTGEVDRVFPGVENSLTIESESRIHITHHNCPSVIVWNPGSINAARITDIGAGQEQHYICVERGAVLDEEWQLAPGEIKTAWLEIA
jgi:glucose-6-phosphate 1-epimerase